MSPSTSDIIYQLLIGLNNFLKPSVLSGALFWAFICGVVAWLVGRALRLAVHRVIDSRGQGVDPTAVTFLGQLARLLVYLIACVFYAHLVPQLSKLAGGLLTSVGILSVVVGLAAQNTLGNLIAGISLFLYRPFKLGDRVQVIAPTGLETGIIENLGLGYTTVRTPDLRLILIPNSAMASQTSVNLSVAEPRATCLAVVNLTYDADIDKARAILADVAKVHPRMLELVGCRVTALTHQGVTMTLTMLCDNADTAVILKCDILEAAKKRFDAEGITIAREGMLGAVPVKK